MNNETLVSEIKEYNTEEIRANLNLFSELLQCSEKISLSCYNSSGALLSSNITNNIYDTFFRRSGLLDEAIKNISESRNPLIATGEFGIIWSIVYELNSNDELLQFHVLVPIFSIPLTEEYLNEIMNVPEIRQKWKNKLRNYLEEIPIVTATEFFKYTLMLHHCVTKEYLKPSDLIFTSFKQSDSSISVSNTINYAQYWTNENFLMNIIRKGDIYYKAKVGTTASVMQSFHLPHNMDLAFLKQLCSSFIMLCVRAAIDGGISPDSAYTRGVMYLNNLNSAKSFADVLPVCNNVFEDFLFQVHNLNEGPKYSKTVTDCISYIETHANEPISIESLAALLGYSNYYLSRCFKSETGMSINSYIKHVRIEHASYLLVTTDMKIQDISDYLQFGNRNFFTKVFTEETGISPGEFRIRHKKLI